MFTLTRRTAPLASVTAFSSAGPSCLQGPHQGAQKSTMTGTSREASRTSAAKVARELSFIYGLAPAGDAGFAAPVPTGLPLDPINAIAVRLRFWLKHGRSGRER